MTPGWSRSASRAGSATLVGLCAACALSEPVVELPATGAQAVLVISVPEGGEAEGYALSLAAGPEPYVSVPAPEGPSRLFGLGYRCSLAALELAPGPIPLTTGPGRDLPAADWVVRAETGGSSGPDPVPATQEELSALHLAGSAPTETLCPSFDAELFVLRDQTRHLLRFLVGLDAGEVLAATGDGVFYLNGPAGLVELTALATTTPSLGAFYAPSGELWLAGARGETARGDPRTGLDAGPPLETTDPGTRVWLAGPGDASADFELFALTAGRALEHFDGTSWTLLTVHPGAKLDGRAGLVWLAPGEALAVGLLERRALLVRATGELSEEELPDTPVAIAALPGFGVVAGTESGALFQRTGAGGWRPLFAARTGDRVRALAAFGGGILTGSGGGVITFHHPSRADCPAVSFTGGDLNHLVAVEGGVVLGAARVGEPDVIGRLRARPAATSQACPEEVGP